MAQVKPADMRASAMLPAKAGSAAVAPSSVRPSSAPSQRPPVDVEALSARPSLDDFVADFVAPTQTTANWLHSPLLGLRLKEAVAALAADESAPSAERYAVAVLETHLDARQSLSRATNALLKT